MRILDTKSIIVAAIGTFIALVISIFASYSSALTEVFPIFLIGPFIFVVYNVSLVSLTNSITSLTNHLVIKLPIFLVLGNLLPSIIFMLIKSFGGADTSAFDVGAISYTISSLILASFIVILIVKHYLDKDEETTDQALEKTSNNTLLTMANMTILVVTLMIVFAMASDYLRLDQTVNIDAYHHLTAIKEIFHNGKFELLLTNINDTFTLATYIPFFHYIFGLPIAMAGIENSVISYRIFEYIFIAFASLGIYYFVSAYTKKPILGLLTAIINVTAFESFGAYTSSFLLPQTFTALLFFLAMLYVLYTEKVSVKWMLFFLILLSLSHFFVGVIGMSLLVLALLVRKFKDSLGFIITMTTIILFFIFLSTDIIGLSIQDSLKEAFGDISSRESEFITLGAINLANVLFRSFFILSPIIIIFSLLSIFRKEWGSKLLTLLLIAVLAVIAIKVPYSNKLIVLVHYLSIILIIYGLSAMNLFKSYFWLIIVILMIPAQIYIYQINYNLFKDIFVGQDRKIHLMDYEYSAAKEIQVLSSSVTDRDNPGATYVISDPLTMQMIEPICECITAGGLFTSEEKRVEIWNILQKVDIENFTKKYQSGYGIYNLKDIVELSEYFSNDTFILITPRTIMWTKAELDEISGYGFANWRIE